MTTDSALQSFVTNLFTRLPWPYPDQDWAGDFLDARKARLGDVLEDVGTKTLKYLYDFGDGWEHTIKVERLIDPESGILYPRLIEAKGHCPPEDIGGPWGYGEFLEAIADPSHERHRELKEWFADDFNPHVVDVDWLSQALWHDLGSFDFQIAGFGKLKRRNLAAEQALNDTLPTCCGRQADSPAPGLKPPLGIKSRHL